MPQMSPMNWFIFSIYMMLLFWSYSSLIHFFSMMKFKKMEFIPMKNTFSLKI